MDALLHGQKELIHLLWRGRFLKLSVISKRMVKKRVAVDHIREGCGLENEKSRAQNRSLWDSTAMGTVAELQLLRIQVPLDSTQEKTLTKSYFMCS